MTESLSEKLTAQFYKWETRGRGWHLFGEPVDLEPQFYPFFGHRITMPPVTDDAARPGLFNRIIGLAKKKKVAVADDTIDYYDIPDVDAYVIEDYEELKVLGITLPKDEKVEVKDMAALLLMLSTSRNSISFEIVATAADISLQFVCAASDTGYIESQVQAYFPNAVVQHKGAPDKNLLLSNPDCCILELGLREEFMRPLVMAEKATTDMYVGLFATLEQLYGTESAIVQVLFKGACNPWAESIMRSVTDSDGDPFFADDPDMTKLAKEKVASPLFAACIRVVGQAENAERAGDIATSAIATIIRATKSPNNSLIVLNAEDYDSESLQLDVLLRRSHRLGMLLNTEEVATLVHLPSPNVRSKKFERDSQKTKAAPENTVGHKMVLGMNYHQGIETEVSVPNSLRLRHSHIIGATGTGKSTLLLSMIAQDMQNGSGLGVLDPHGDLIEAILTYVPKSRIKDVILVDPADGEYPVAFNILSAHSEIEKDILSSDLVAAFKRLSTSWGDQMNSVLANAILAFLESNQGGTLVDLRRFLVEKPFRDSYLKTVSDPHVVYYWQREYPLLKSNSIGSILTRLDTFLRPKLIRNMVAQKKGLDFEQILDTKKILLVKLPQGLIGAENSFLLGTFFVTKIYQAAMARQAKSKSDRNDFFLFIDEFQNFITPSMSHILSGARKYHLGLILAHQDMQQLQKYDTELASSVVVNAGTRVCFRLGDTDAKRFAGGFSYFDEEDLQNLHTGEAIARIEQPNHDFNLATVPLPEMNASEAELVTKLVIEKSRQTYGTNKEEIEVSLQHLGKLEHEKATHTEPEQIQEEKTKPTPESFKSVEIPLQPETVKKAVQTQHRYLQTFIKRMAEARGYIARIEELTPDGKGRVDVSLERDGKKIAIEVSVTTDDVWEVHNVEKCLAAGYDTVIVCSEDLKNLGHIKTRIAKKFNDIPTGEVLVFELQEVLHYLDSQLVRASTTEKTIKGYRVNVTYGSKNT